tara:strand:+ start:745 stop:2394 length:1650 start_codon:yes stop_codon:yes gene_type:complete
MYKKSIFNNSLPDWYMNYGERLNEQAAAPSTFSEDTNERIKQYIDANENLLSDIDALYQTVPDGTVQETFMELDSNKYAVLAGDEFNMVIDKSDADAPKISISIENEKLLLAGIDLDAAAGYVYKSMDGSGTYEDMYSGALAAITKVLLDKGISQRGQQRVFDIFNNKAFGTKFEGYSLDDWIDGDFDGRTEACAMALAKRPIPKSMTRGINWGTIGLDILLMAVPYVGPLVASGLKGGVTAFKATKLSGKLLAKQKQIKATADTLKKTKAVQKMIGAGKVFTKITPGIANAWKGLSAAARLRYVKIAYPVGKKMKWVVGTANGGTKEIDVVVKAYKLNKNGKQIANLHRVGLNGVASGAGPIQPLLVNFMAAAGKAGGPAMSTATKLAVGAGLVGLSKGETGNLDGTPTGDPGTGGQVEDDMFNVWNPAEFMGYYDQSAADPEKAMAQFKNLAAGELASRLHDAMDGWTDNSDELAIALMVMSMDKQIAIDTKTAYEKAYPGTNFYNDVIANELESDMEQIVGNYWAALTGDGPHVANVNKYVSFIAK